MKWQYKYISNKKFHKVMYWIVEKTLGVRSQKMLDYWAWNMTPMPCGYPFPIQYVVALWAGLFGKFPKWYKQD